MPHCSQCCSYCYITVFFVCVCIPQLYIEEISYTNVVEVVTNVAVSLGSLLLYSLGSLPGMEYYNLALVQIGISLIYLLLVIAIPETPLWVLWKKNNKKLAIKIIQKLYGKKVHIIRGEIASLDSSVDDISIGVCQEIKLIFCNSYYLIPFILLMVLSVYQQLSGGQTVIPSYAGLIFKQAGAPNPNTASTYSVGVPVVVATVLTGICIAKLRRKVLLSISAAGMLVGTFTIGTSNFFIDPFFRCPKYDPIIDDYVYASSCKYLFPITAISITIFMLSYGTGVGPVPSLLFTEYMPKSVRGFTRAVANILNGIAGMFIIGVFPSYVNIPLNYLAWWSLAFINLLGLVFIVLFVKETEDKTYDQVRDSFCFGTGYSCECCKISHET